MSKITGRLFPLALYMALLALILLPAACGGPSRPTPTALPPSVARPEQPTPDFSDSADLFYLARATQVAPASLSPVGNGFSQPDRGQSQVDLPAPPMLQPPTALGIVRFPAALRQIPGGPILNSLPAGTTLTVTGRSSSGELLAVFTAAGLSGWIAAGNVMLFGADDLRTMDETVDMGAIATLIAAAMQPVELPTRLPAAVASELEYGATVIGDQQLAIRANAYQAADIMTYLEAGQKVKPLARTADGMWLMISSGANLGWIPVDSVLLEAPLESLLALPQP